MGASHSAGGVGWLSGRREVGSTKDQGGFLSCHAQEMRTGSICRLSVRVRRKQIDRAPRDLSGGEKGGIPRSGRWTVPSSSLSSRTTPGYCVASVPTTGRSTITQQRTRRQERIQW